MALQVDLNGRECAMAQANAQRNGERQSCEFVVGAFQVMTDYSTAVKYVA